MKNYRTIRENGSFELTVKRSRFICTLKRTETEEEATDFIASLKKEHEKANHNCSAYIIGDDNQIQRASDDGEPSGTAGVPILEVLKKREIKNVTAVVTRYFGGTKLGAGGLIRAYGSVTSEALSHLGIVEKQLQQMAALEVAYPLSGKIQNTLHQSPYRLHDIDYGENVTFHCLIPVEKIDDFYKDTTEWTNDQGSCELGPKAWIEMPVS